MKTLIVLFIVIAVIYAAYKIWQAGRVVNAILDGTQDEPRIVYTSPVSPEDGDAFKDWLHKWHREHNGE